MYIEAKKLAGVNLTSVMRIIRVRLYLTNY